MENTGIQGRTKNRGARNKQTKKETQQDEQGSNGI